MNKQNLKIARWSARRNNFEWEMRREEYEDWESAPEFQVRCKRIEALEKRNKAKEELKSLFMRTFAPRVFKALDFEMAVTTEQMILRLEHVLPDKRLRRYRRLITPNQIRNAINAHLHAQRAEESRGTQD